VTEQDEATRTQVIVQCNVVVHLASVIARLHADLAEIYSHPNTSPGILEAAGKRTASFMEQIGDMLNAVDAVTEEDEWTEPVFKEAQRRWPTAPRNT
jgi:hypothetical protein